MRGGFARARTRWLALAVLCQLSPRPQCAVPAGVAARPSLPCAVCLRVRGGEDSSLFDIGSGAPEEAGDGRVGLRESTSAAGAPPVSILRARVTCAPRRRGWRSAALNVLCVLCAASHESVEDSVAPGAASLPLPALLCCAHLYPSLLTAWPPGRASPFLSPCDCAAAWHQWQTGVLDTRCGLTVRHPQEKAPLQRASQQVSFPRRVPTQTSCAMRREGEREREGEMYAASLPSTQTPTLCVQLLRSIFASALTRFPRNASTSACCRQQTGAGCDTHEKGGRGGRGRGGRGGGGRRFGARGPRRQRYLAIDRGKSWDACAQAQGGARQANTAVWPTRR